MRYKWDEAKNFAQPAEVRRNLVRAGGAGLRGRALPDRIDSKTEEQRGHAIGLAQIEPEDRAVLVVHAYRENHYAEEIIRIISAPAAEKHEIRRYREQAMD
jgi:uncharacterized DUF497 family protein